MMPSARAMAFSRSGLAWQAGSAQTYVPRPGIRPLASITASPSAVRTMRCISRLVRTVRQTAHVRCGW